MQIIFVGIGGFIGAILRFMISGYVMRVTPDTGFPYGTLAVNIIGCFVLGALSGFIQARGAFGPEVRALVLVGMLGAFTTFSTFSLESFVLFNNGSALLGGLNIMLSVLLGWMAVLAGWSLAQ